MKTDRINVVIFIIICKLMNFGWTKVQQIKTRQLIFLFKKDIFIRFLQILNTDKNYAININTLTINT